MDRNFEAYWHQSAALVVEPVVFCFCTAPGSDIAMGWPQNKRLSDFPYLSALPQSLRRKEAGLKRPTAPPGSVDAPSWRDA